MTNLLEGTSDVYELITSISYIAIFTYDVKRRSGRACTPGKVRQLDSAPACPKGQGVPLERAAF